MVVSFVMIIATQSTCDLKALVIGLQHIVDNASNSISAINGRCAISQYLDSVQEYRN